ncbi:MAG: hypothetical protein IPO21_19580 [Bacteroidales bacterium]|nr:hypothetical protein [Bacteroidales bacterium]
MVQIVEGNATKCGFRNGISFNAQSDSVKIPTTMFLANGLTAYRKSIPVNSKKAL